MSIIQYKQGTITKHDTQSVIVHYVVEVETGHSNIKVSAMKYYFPFMNIKFTSRSLINQHVTEISQ